MAHTFSTLAVAVQESESEESCTVPIIMQPRPRAHARPPKRCVSVLQAPTSTATAAACSGHHRRLSFSHDGPSRRRLSFSPEDGPAAFASAASARAGVVAAATAVFQATSPADEDSSDEEEEAPLGPLYSQKSHVPVQPVQPVPARCTPVWLRCFKIGLLMVALLAAAALPVHQHARRSREQAIKRRSPLDRRSLLDPNDALSNSNGCLATIPKCEPGACATRNVMGVARWVCLRCLANYEPVVDASGQDNILQCVCPKGYFESAAATGSCSRCPANSYCPGGDKTENPASFGAAVVCGTNLVTRNTGARSQADCVAPAGYAQTSPNAASACARASYAPPFNRLAKCLVCQSGLEEPLSSTLVDGQRDSKRTVCMIPPGKYVSQGLVRICPQGFYRANYVLFDAPVGTLCLACNPGVTTGGSGAKSGAECNKVLPGYGIDAIANVTSVLDIPMLPQDDAGLPPATVCNIGFYSGGGYCLQCPRGTTTRAKGSKSIEECMVPPGYVMPRGGWMTGCAAGTFREGWRLYNDPAAATCTPCGEGISSEPHDLDEHPLALNGSLVRATSSSCFIEAGQGMIASGKNTFVAQDCPINTYGAAGKVYGWAAAPCKPCPRNMITDGAVRVNDSDVCVNDDGFGYASEGASRCAPGFYSAKGSRKPCQQCPQGRTTADLPSAQRLVTDCLVKPGFGVASSANATDAFSVDTSGLTDAQLLELPVLECPAGYYGAGNATGAKCEKCPDGASTEGVGSSSLAQCSTCAAGYGKLALSVGASSACTLCDFGAYNPGGSASCTACPSATFYAPVDGAGQAWTSNGTTLTTGTWGVEGCVPRESQLSPEAGQAYFSAALEPELLTAVPGAVTLAACMAACPREAGCMMQFDVAAAACKVVSLPWDPPSSGASTGTKLLYKLPPATLGSASSVTPTGADGHAKTISSGLYARMAVTDASLASWLKAGVPLDPRTAQRFVVPDAAPAWDGPSRSEAECKKKCDDSNTCFGFLFDTATASCLFKGGEDKLSTRAFFVLPSLAGSS